MAVLRTLVLWGKPKIWTSSPSVLDCLPQWKAGLTITPWHLLAGRYGTRPFPFESRGSFQREVKQAFGVRLAFKPAFGAFGGLLSESQRAVKPKTRHAEPRRMSLLYRPDLVLYGLGS